MAITGRVTALTARLTAPPCKTPEALPPGIRMAGATAYRHQMAATDRMVPIWTTLIGPVRQKRVTASPREAFTFFGRKSTSASAMKAIITNDRTDGTLAPVRKT